MKIRNFDIAEYPHEFRNGRLYRLNLKRIWCFITLFEKGFYSNPGVGDYQVDTSVERRGVPPQTHIQLVCIESVNPSVALLGLANANANNEFAACKNAVLEDTEAVAKIEVQCAGAQSLLAMEKPSKNILKIISSNFWASSEASVKTISTARWLRRPCTVKPAANNSSADAKPLQRPQATAVQCRELTAQIAKLEASKGQMPAGTFDQVLPILQRSIKTQGCS